ncbi:NAD(P)-dependent glycerol-3-phosphate dehydrogenase [Paenibacillus sp. TRM 82003]|uniref:NAD(P)H-dependent glycerol-3-phosphate dehydrogenase n=1 Tax=Kineococcus sp. TRM81007 TaxID=2925831 RepID=UPI001F59CA16|nr:NAD(P)H-dependent glycerol-3-phosphate dehydrogenase [Kineococcus sp. TRM81007]MCI2240198.1 NAD(P)-dependent glycerol-3-phosphate dehydrogenase [Kineococcus sp. TRM81007]MCI3927624.1 NAD(P)-dependent glycerol-3-phosphate dehydrogenase [Paenibacillus sp. TRM 82003]
MPLLPPSPSPRVAVLGAGAWGSAFALVLADAGHRVALWARRPELAAELRERRTNRAYLGDVALPDAVEATSDAAEALTDADLVVLAVPLQRLREQLGTWLHLLPPAPLVCLAKGVEAGTGLFGTEVVAEVTAAGPERLVAVSGPNLAAEIARRQPAATVAACTDPAVAAGVAAACTSSAFHAEPSTDVLGVDVAGAVKNVVALAVGVVEGAGHGANARAAVLTRGLAETTRLGIALGADAATFAGLAGVGDLVATCGSPLSRNHRAGVALGRGAPLAEALAAAGGTVEGVTSAPAVLRRAGTAGVAMPLVEQVAAAVAAGRAPDGLAARLVGA